MTTRPEAVIAHFQITNRDGSYSLTSSEVFWDRQVALDWRAELLEKAGRYGWKAQCTVSAHNPDEPPHTVDEIANGVTFKNGLDMRGRFLA